MFEDLEINDMTGIIYTYTIHIAVLKFNNHSESRKVEGNHLLN